MHPRPLVEGAATRLDGPLLFLRRTLEVGLNDAVEVRGRDGRVRLGRVAALDDEFLTIEVLETTAGLAQGKLNMLNGKVTNEFNNRGLFEGVKIQEGLLSDKERVMLRSDGAVDAATFVGLVGRAVTGNWIQTGEMR